jgi:S1-C subfamily serine protease
MTNELVTLSNATAAAVERAASAVVAVQARVRFASSGVHWRSGIVVSAAHTIKRRDGIRVTLPDGRAVAATLIGSDPGTDVAALGVEESGLPLPVLAPDEALHPGQIVVAVGRSPEVGVHATMGVMSAVSGPWRTWRGASIDRYLRLDLGLYPGSSGGAVADAEGRVLGIATSALSRVAGLAIPAATVARVLEEILAKGYVARAYLGVGLQPVRLPASLARRLAIDPAQGMLVVSLEADGPAEKAGLLIGDVILNVGGSPVGDIEEVQSLLESVVPGESALVNLVRGGERQELRLATGERPRRDA